MPKCPNCGRETLRTEDWACQWCGHPLLSGAFKKIPKTYREIQEERVYKAGSVLEDEPEPATVAEVELEPAPPPAPEPEPEMEPETPPPPEPVAEAEVEAEVAKETMPPSGPVAVTEAEAEPAPSAEAEAATEIEPEVETVSAPAPVAAPALEPDKTAGTINMTVEELNAALNSDKAGTNAKLMNQVVRVTGTVGKVFARDNLDIYYIILGGAGGPSSWQVRCTFSREHNTYLSRLTDGQTASVQGTYAGYERNIILKECSLVS